MRYRLFGSSGMRVSEVCLGTMSFGDAWGFGADEQDSHRIMEAFAEAGGNFIDTANKYHEGQSEEIVGSCLASDRDYWVVGSKYSLAMREGDPNAAGNSRKNLHRSVEASLRRLGTDHLDILWVHAWDYTVPAEEVVRALDDLVRAGTVHAIGLSDTPAWVVSRAATLAELRGWTPVVALQDQYSLIARTAERELLPVADALDLTFTAWAPMGAGVLTGKYSRDLAASPEDSLRASANADRRTERNLAIAHEVDAVADELGASSAQVALAWVRRRAVIPVVGARTVGQIEENLGCLDVELSRQQADRLDEASSIELGDLYDLLSGPSGQIVYGNLEPSIDLPVSAPIRWAS